MFQEKQFDIQTTKSQRQIKNKDDSEQQMKNSICLEEKRFFKDLEEKSLKQQQVLLSRYIVKKSKKHIFNFKNLKCPECDKKYQNKFIFYTHLKNIHQMQPNKCKSCEKSFKTVKGLKDHIRNEHLNVNQNLIQRVFNSSPLTDCLEFQSLKQESSDWENPKSSILLKKKICKKSFPVKNETPEFLEEDDDDEILDLDTECTSLINKKEDQRSSKVSRDFTENIDIQSQKSYLEITTKDTLESYSPSCQSLTPLLSAQKEYLYDSGNIEYNSLIFNNSNNINHNIVQKFASYPLLITQQSQIQNQQQYQTQQSVPFQSQYIKVENPTDEQIKQQNYNNTMQYFIDNFDNYE